MDEASVETGSPFYIHANNSSSSNFHSQAVNVSSNVSSVGFNNLKKTTTNSSSGSNISTATIKTNPLSRLFTKNRSVSNVFQPPLQLGSKESLQANSDDDSISTITSLDPKKTGATSKFRLSSKSRLFSKSVSAKPDLKIQTSGHHGLKVSKKILSSNSANDSASISGKKSSSAIPASTFHNLFHRSQSNTQASGDGQNSNNSVDYNGTQNINNSTRTSLSLSSNNSNSYVSDIKFAMVYKFTDPDYSVEEADAPTDHTSILDIHKKLMVPTDQYLQNRIGKSSNQEVGLGISGENDSDGDYSPQPDIGNSNSKFYDNLLRFARPLFTPTLQQNLSNGKKHPYLGCTIEDLASAIKENFAKEFSNNTVHNSSSANDMSSLSVPQKMSKSKSKPTKFHRASSTTSISSGIEQTLEKFDEFKIREISLDLFTFFVKCMTILKKDFSFVFKATESTLSLQGTSSSSSNLLKSWAKLSATWTYFNRKIRYFVLGMFQPMQNYFHQIYQANLSENQPGILLGIEIENSLLLAFRDVIIIPILVKRNSLYKELLYQDNGLSDTPLASPAIPESPELSQEELLLRKHASIVYNVIDCFGAISAINYSQSGNTEAEKKFKNSLFDGTFDWLTSIR